MRDCGVFELFEKPVPCLEAQAVLDKVSRYDNRSMRQEVIRRYGFSVPCSEAVAVLAALSPLVEVGAGSGYWAKLLREAGADIVATDAMLATDYSHMWVGAPVERMTAQEAVAKWPERNVFVSWPSRDMPWAAEMAGLMRPGRTLAYIGEGRGGCTADKGFFELLGSGFFESSSLRIPRWDCINDELRIYVRK
jgi:hypothetical protein